MICYLSVDDVIYIHRKAMLDSGDPPWPVINRSTLESAVGQPAASWGGVDLYSSVLEKAAVLFHSLANNHAFDNGNKRGAWNACATFLAMNGAPLGYIEDAVIADFCEEAVGDHYDRQRIAAWLLDRLAPLD